jgi:Ca2+-transporting ATPase
MNPKQDVEGYRGLTEEEAARRLRDEGYNELPSSKQRSILAIAWDLVREPMLLLLFGWRAHRPCLLRGWPVALAS